MQDDGEEVHDRAKLISAHIVEGTERPGLIVQVCGQASSAGIDSRGIVQQVVIQGGWIDKSWIDITANIPALVDVTSATGEGSDKTTIAIAPSDAVVDLVDGTGSG